ncbi:unnamed protein product [Calypogeia fissa]
MKALTHSLTNPSLKEETVFDIPPFEDHDERWSTQDCRRSWLFTVNTSRPLHRVLEKPQCEKLDAIVY